MSVAARVRVDPAQLEDRAQEYSEIFSFRRSERRRRRITLHRREASLLRLEAWPFRMFGARELRLYVDDLTAVIVAIASKAGWHVDAHNPDGSVECRDPGGQRIVLFERSGLDRDEVLQISQQITESERHFNDLQARYRLLASTWLLASLGALVVLYLNATDLPVAARFSARWMYFGVGFGAAAGVQLLYLLDVNTYHRLLLRSFDAGVMLEREHPWLHQVRQGGHVGAERSANWFYFTVAVAPLVAAALVTYLARIVHQDVAVAYGAALAFLVSILGWQHRREIRT